MNKKYNAVLFILRGQPVHNAHYSIIQRASMLAEKVIIIIGSAKKPRTYKNPFTFEERASMIDPTLFIADVSIDYNIDTIYNDTAWASRIQAVVGKYTNPGDKIAIIGHEKDSSSFYLKMFPQWKRENVELIEPLHATDIRSLYFKKDANMNFIKNVVPRATFDFLTKFKDTPAFNQTIQEREFIAQYRKQYESLPYPPIFVTADSVVICSGHVLMIKRKANPGKGLWALPGGFVNAASDKSVQDTAIRELREETGIKVPAPVLIGNIQGNKVFDAIDRSERGRTITHAFKITLNDTELPKVKGSDDAERAMWVPIADVKSEECFEDHFELLSWSIGG